MDEWMEAFKSIASSFGNKLFFSEFSYSAKTGMGTVRAGKGMSVSVLLESGGCRKIQCGRISMRWKEVGIYTSTLPNLAFSSSSVHRLLALSVCGDWESESGSESESESESCHVCVWSGVWVWVMWVYVTEEEEASGRPPFGSSHFISGRASPQVFLVSGIIIVVFFLWKSISYTILRLNVVI